MLDESYKSDYKLETKLSAKGKVDLAKFLGLLGLSPTGLEFALPKVSLAQSPTALTLSTDTDAYEIDDTVTFDLERYPSNINYPLYGYNIDEITIYRKFTSSIGGVTAIEVTSFQPDSSGQASFSADWVADHDGAISDGFYAFATTGLMPKLAAGIGTLEFGVASPLTANAISPIQLGHSRNRARSLAERFGTPPVTTANT